jgi:hypothetical protein
MTDHSDFIALLAVRIQILQELDPEGPWQHNPYLLAYLRNRYSLSLSQAQELEIFLGKEVEAAAASKKYKQLDLLEG